MMNHQIDPPLTNERAKGLLASYVNFEMSSSYRTLISFIDSIELS